jgi:hypothetical protein
LNIYSEQPSNNNETVRSEFLSISDFLFDNKQPNIISNNLSDDEDNNSIEEEETDNIKMNYNYKDFCGSQEWENQIKKQVNSPYYHLISQQSQNNSSKSIPPSKQTNESNQFYLTGDFTYSSLKSSSEIITNNNNNNNNNDELTNFYHSSLISDYRLTLTDLIDLNLIDISNGLIINPLNGRRLTVADAIRIDLLNTDVKEIANTFMNMNEVTTTTAAAATITTSCLKLTIKEAIKYSVLNPFRNEIYLSATNLNLKLNLNEARKRNLILKPLTLSEAFIRNLIQPNGFVRNPINNKYYTFETLISVDRMLPKSDNQFYLFDLETKHIIDPNDYEKKLLSLAEAIDMGLILPHTFELNLTNNRKSNKQQERLNLYDAFFNCQHMNLNLLLYKPEIENVYIRLAQSIKNNNNKNNSLAIVLSRRDKIGLIEAINLNVINLKHKTYSILNETVISLDEAASLYKHTNNKLVDSDLIDLLNTSIGFINNVTVLDCINDNSLILERYLFRNPFTNEYIQLDSHACKALLGDHLVKRIKRLITRINVKSYMISLNTPCLQDMNCNRNKMIPPTKLTNQKPETKINQMEISKDSITSVWNGADESSPSIYSTSLGEDQQKSNLIKETKSYVLDYVIDTNPSLYSKVDLKLSGGGVTLRPQKLSIQEAKKRGILNVEKGLYVDVASNRSMPIDHAIHMGLIGARVAVHEKSNVLLENCSIENNNNKNNDKFNLNTKNNITHESSTLTIESVLDVRTGISHSISEAIKLNILDQVSLSVKNTATGQIMTLNEAFLNGYAKGALYENHNDNNNLIENIKSNESSMSSSNSTMSNESQVIYSKTTNMNESNPKTCLVEKEEKSLRIETVLNTKTKTWISLEEAINIGIFDHQKGLYIEPKTGQKMNLNEAFCKGFIYCTEIPEEKSSILKIDVNKTKQQQQSLLYEVHESHQVTYPARDEHISTNLERIEQIIEDEDYDELPPELVSNQLLRRNKNKSGSGSTGGIRQHILERRIPSLYGSESQMSAETLVIDDVRQSAMLDIDGVTHVIKNEVLIDSDPKLNENSNSSSFENSFSSNSSSSSSIISTLNENNKKKVANRAVIVVDDKFINRSKLIKKQSSYIIENVSINFQLYIIYIYV